MCTNLLVIGASARAFAASACRLGMKVNAIDLFGDQDLREVCGQVVQVPANDYPNGLPTIAATFPESPMVYTGGLENHVKVLRRLSSARTLIGNVPEAVEKVRDTTFVQDLARKNGCNYPTTFYSSSGLPKDGTYLRKPIASIGGKGIMPWLGFLEKTCANGEIWQEFVAGVPMSASLLVSPEGIEVLSVCRQLIGRAWCRAKQFSFCGAVELSDVGSQKDMRSRLFQFASALVEKVNLTGLIGIDFVMPRKMTRNSIRKPTILEVNPRPTATMELTERRTGQSQAGLHLSANGFPLPTNSPVLEGGRDICWGKAVVFAEKPLYVSTSFNHHLARCASSIEDHSFGWPMITDRPCCGTVIQAGHPISTVFASAQTPSDVLRRLREHVSEIVRVL